MPVSEARPLSFSLSPEYAARVPVLDRAVNLPLAESLVSATRTFFEEDTESFVAEAAFDVHSTLAAADLPLTAKLEVGAAITNAIRRRAQRLSASFGARVQSDAKELTHRVLPTRKKKDHPRGAYVDSKLATCTFSPMAFFFLSISLLEQWYLEHQNSHGRAYLTAR